MLAPRFTAHQHTPITTSVLTHTTSGTQAGGDQKTTGLAKEEATKKTSRQHWEPVATQAGPSRHIRRPRTKRIGTHATAFLSRFCLGFRINSGESSKNTKTQTATASFFRTRKNHPRPAQASAHWAKLQTVTLPDDTQTK